MARRVNERSRSFGVALSTCIPPAAGQPIFDLPPDVGLERAHARAGAEMRFESKGEAFHARLREGFRAIAAAEPDRCAVIDAAQPLEAVEAAVWDAVQARLAVHG